MRNGAPIISAVAGRGKRTLLAWGRRLRFEVRAARIRLRQSAAPIEAASFAPSGDSPAAGREGFDGERAFALLRRQCDLGSRAPGTPGHASAFDLLAGELARWTDAVAVQSWSQLVERGAGAGRRYPMRNLYALLRGTDDSATPPDRIRPDLMLCAHWDTRPVADHDPDPARRGDPVPGASDGASGVAVLLELARVLRSSRPRRSLVLALWDGEDLGEHYYGSRMYGKVCRLPENAPWRPGSAVLLDMVGGEGVRCTTELGSREAAPALWDEVHRAADDLGLASRFHGPPRRITDDHVFLNRAGIPAIVLIDYSYPYWHTTADSVDHCSAESLQVVGDVLLRFVRKRDGEER